MAGAAAGASQGAGEGNLSEGQTNGEGAPKAPEVNNGAGGDGIVPVEDAKAKEAEEKAKAAQAEEDADAADEDDTDEEDEPKVTDYVEFEDPSAQAAVDILKEAGVSPAEAEPIFAEAVKNNDPRLIDVAALEAKVGKTKALLIMNGVQDYHRRATETNNEVVNMVHETFGGEASWNVVKTWAQTREKTDKKFAKELDDIRDDLNKGGRAARAAAKDLLKMYNGSPDTKGLGDTKKLHKGGSGKPAAAEPLTRAEYLTALKKAHAEGASQAIIGDLDRRRMAGKAKGI